MASSSENLSLFDSWNFRPTFPDSWISEAYARDTDALTRALQQSLSTAPTPAPKPRRSTNSTTTSSAPGATGKVTKRKSRAASKKSQTTFITADPANFRQMVQQVTGGVRFTDAMVPVLKPEPHRLGRGGAIQLQQHHVAAAAAGGGGGGGGGGLLPTLDTSAFLLDHHRQIQQQQALVGDGPDGGGAGLDFGTFSNFPTLESWKVI
ncbi:unnamed protein product [Linum tenue]|uniref:VQ domain-containing protein n=1 Tax=Linum tenue TaxID=586396 RepID=A0AAV0J995_9ROSI|nr:unnamed protein product [Linum tenue]